MLVAGGMCIERVMARISRYLWGCSFRSIVVGCLVLVGKLIVKRWRPEGRHLLDFAQVCNVAPNL